MAITSVGYPGPITPAQLSDWAAGLGGTYRVERPEHLRVAALANGLRQSQVAAGVGHGHAIRDSVPSGDSRIVTHDPMTSAGTRWDLVVLRRNWTTKVTTIAVVTGTTNQADAINSRNKVRGGIDDQPLALVPVSFNAANPGTPIDLRVWRNNGGTVARHELALQFLGEDPATEVLIGNRRWTRVVNAGDTLGWHTDHAAGIPLHGVAGLLSGAGASAGPTGSTFAIQAGSWVGTTDLSGWNRLKFPVSFTGGLLTVVATNGDTQTAPGNPEFGWAGASPADPVYKQTEALYGWRHQGALRPSTLHRLNYIAIGWL